MAENNDNTTNNSVTTGSPVNSAMQKVYENTNLDLTKKIMQSDLYQQPAIIFIVIGVFLAFMIMFNTLGVTYL